MTLSEAGPASVAAPWFALQVKTTHEKRVDELLEYGGFDSFLPVYESRRAWSDRIKHVQLPLFPGYVFCRFVPSDRVRILKTPSVIRIVGIGYKPIPIDQEEIAAIQTVLRSGLRITPHPYLRVGQRVQIKGGSFDGLEGMIADQRSRDRLIISVTLLQRSVAVEIDGAWVVPVHSAATYNQKPELRSNSALIDPAR